MIDVTSPARQPAADGPLRPIRSRAGNGAFSESTAPATAARVTREANLIARTFACHGRARAASEAAEHIRLFWAPQLRSTLLEQIRAHPERFVPIAHEAIALLERAG